MIVAKKCSYHVEFQISTQKPTSSPFQCAARISCVQIRVRHYISRVCLECGGDMRMWMYSTAPNVLFMWVDLLLNDLSAQNE